MRQNAFNYEVGEEPDQSFIVMQYIDQNCLEDDGVQSHTKMVVPARPWHVMGGAGRSPSRDYLLVSQTLIGSSSSHGREASLGTTPSMSVNQK